MSEIRCPIGKAAEKYDSKDAIITPGQVLSYRELDLRVSATASELKEAGFRPGERIAIYSPNDWRTIILLFALLRLKATACLLNTRVPQINLGPLLDSIRCRKLISPSHPNLKPAHTGFTLYDLDRFMDRESLIHTGSEGREIQLDEPATIMFTSGSTGRPKAVLHSYGNHFYSALGANENIRLGGGDRWLLTLPLYHVGALGILFRCLLSGASVVLPDASQAIEESMEFYRITHVSMVPTQLHRMLFSRKEPKKYEGLKALLLGGGPIPSTLLKEGEKVGLPLFSSYGLTEMTSQVTTTQPNSPQEKRFTAGKVLKYRQLRIADNDEIMVRGETLSPGYVEDEKVRPATNSEGWFATGDLGRFDSEGYLTVFGRKDNMFVSGGENIHPEEIEMALTEIPDVAQSLVVPIPDEEFGHRPIAFIQTQTETVDPARIRKELEIRLPRYKIPIAFYDFPDVFDPERLKPDRDTLKQLASDLYFKKGT